MADLGLKSGTVNLVDYNPKWPELFLQESNILRQTLALAKSSIEHVGSTSIPGMIAKPILDIAVLVDDLEIAEQWKDKLKSIGYWYKEFEPEIPDRRFFAKGPRSKRTVYLHVVNSKEFDSLLKFRDSLRSSSALAKQYAELKTKQAKTHSNNREEYTKSKNLFIQDVISKP